MDEYYGGWKDPKKEKWNRQTNDASYPLPEFKYTGKRGLGSEGAPDKAEKVSGTGIFGRDVSYPGMLYAKTLMCPYANAKIRSMDTSKAEALPGVRGILRYDDPEWKDAIGSEQSTWGTDTFGMNSAVSGEVGHAEQRIGVAIAADTKEIVDEALKLVEIDWEERDFVIDWDNASEQFVVFNETTEVYGDVDQGFIDADRVIDVKMKRNNTVWAGTEGCVATAVPYGDHYMDVYAHNQVPHNTGYYLSQWFPQCKTHIRAPYHGSQFGSLNWVGYYPSFPLTACILAKKTGKPVQHLYDQSHFDGGSQADGTFEWKIGMKDDGTITAIECWNTCAPAFGRIGGASGGFWCWENYKIKNYRYHVKNVNVAQGRHSCWKHGGGYVLVGVIPIAAVAEELKMNPIDVMMKNNGTCGHDWAWMQSFMTEYGFDPNRDSLKECLDACNKVIDMKTEWHPAGTKILPNGKYHGLGFTVSNQWTHVLGDKGGSWIGLALRPDGTLCIKALRGDQGTGWQGAWVRVAADEMGMKVEDVDLVGVHDEEYFHAHDEGCSGGTISNVMSIVKAARKLKKWVLEAATFKEDNWVITSHGAGWTNVKSLFPDKTPEELDIKDSMVFEKANPSNKVTLGQVVRTVDTGGHGGEHRRPLFDWGWTRNIDPVLNPDIFQELHGWPCLVRNTQFMEIEIDPETGKIDVIKGVAVTDPGKAFYPEGIEQENLGGFITGFTRAGFEELFYDPTTGVQLNNDLIFYPVSVMNDTPNVVAGYVETGGGYGPYGSVGNGETPSASGQSCITTAVYNAIGKWVDAPCTPDRILKALGKI